MGCYHYFFTLTYLFCVLTYLSDSSSDHRGPSAVWKQCQARGEGPRVRPDPQDQDQEGEQPFLRWGPKMAQAAAQLCSFVSLMSFFSTDVFLQCQHAAVRSVWKPHQLQGAYACRVWGDYTLLHASKLLAVFILRQVYNSYSLRTDCLMGEFKVRKSHCFCVCLTSNKRLVLLSHTAGRWLCLRWTRWAQNQVTSFGLPISDLWHVCWVAIYRFSPLCHEEVAPVKWPRWLQFWSERLPQSQPVCGGDRRRASSKTDLWRFSIQLPLSLVETGRLCSLLGPADGEKGVKWRPGRHWE